MTSLTAPQKRSSNLPSILTGALLLVGLGLYSCVTTVPAGQVAVLKKLGAIDRVVDAPGLYLRWPWPFASVVPVDTRTRVLEVAGFEVLTADKFNVIVTVSVGWRVDAEPAQVRRFFKTLKGSVEEAEEKLSSRVKSARKEVINSTSLADLVSSAPEQRARFAAFEERMKALTQGSLDEAGAGLRVDFLCVQNLKFPSSVTEKVFERMRKERERVSESYLAEGRSRAKAIRDAAENARDALLADAEAEAIRMLGEAEAKVAEAYQVFERDAELASWLKRAETLEKILSKRATIVLPSDDPLGALIDDVPTLGGARPTNSKEGQ